VRKNDAIIVLQARMASTRLPGKALKTMHGHTVLARCLARLLASHAAPVILATTTRREDQALVAEAERCGVPAVRGSRDDVLGRFALVAELVSPRFVVRATADNPAVDIDAPRRVLDRLRSSGSDYVVDAGLPHGSGVEGIRAAALLSAAEHATEEYDREHVTPYIRHAANAYRIEEVPAPATICRPDLRFTVDTEADFAWMCRVFAQAGRGAPTLPLVDLIRAADAAHALEEVA
jgi:spore coat polysaccharide biosynthesis protein SpsF (cytidylyltransferase family)